MNAETLHFIGHTLTALCWFFLISYCAFTLVVNYLWNKISEDVPSSPETENKITVIIPVRNEAENIENLLLDLNRQTWPRSHFEVFVMDDNSTDLTASIVENFIKGANINVRLISLTEDNSKSPKKRAIERGISEATGNLIITTDGDCRVGPNWLKSFAHHYSRTKSRMISGPVTFTEETSLFDHLQTVEFASLIGSGAASLEAGYPSMCNGANLMYEKSAFYDTNGFEGVDHLASGDDEFLMHKIATQFPGTVSFLKNRDAIVATKAHDNWTSFFNQRKRWASKWKHYQSKTPLVLAIFIFCSNLSLILALSLFCFGSLSGVAVSLMIALKCVPEWLFLGNVLGFFGKKASWIYIPVTQIFYPLYVCFFGLVAQQPDYQWKGRSLR